MTKIQKWPRPVTESPYRADVNLPLWYRVVMLAIMIAAVPFIIGVQIISVR